MVCGAPIVRTLVKRAGEGATATYLVLSTDALDRQLVLFSVQYACVCALFLLNLRSDVRPREYDRRYAALDQPCPQVSVRRRVLFFFI